jgi:hypothetical protein
MSHTPSLQLAGSLQCAEQPAWHSVSDTSLMEMDARLRALESRHRKLARAAVIAKAHYLALLDEGGASPAVVQRARQSWQQRNAQERAIAARMGNGTVPYMNAGIDGPLTP